MEKKEGKYWFIFSISDVIFITVLVSILIGKADLLHDPNVGLHIRVGDYIMNNLTIPTQDFFSFIRPPIAWTPPEWLADLIFAIIHKPFGLTGVAIFTAFLIAVIYMLLFKFLRSSGVSILVAVLTTLLTAVASGIHWLARPHIFSLMLVLVWYSILDAYQYKQRNYLYLLPLLMVLWVNLHASFSMGFILLVVYIAGNYLKALLAKEQRRESSGRAKTLLLFFFPCVLALLLNPQGYKVIFIPLQLTANPFVVERTIEWLSPNFHQFLIYEYILLLVILVLGLSVKRLNVIEVILILMFTHLSLFAVRFIPLFALIVSPILGKQVDQFIEEFRRKGLFKEFILASDNMEAADSRTKGYLWSIGAMVVVVFLCFTGKIDYHFDKTIMPVDAVQFLKNEKIEGNVFNSDAFGSYMIYEAWPEYEVFYDGRDMHGKEITGEYLGVADVERGWEDVLNKYNINWIFYNNKSTLSNVLLESEDWHLIYSDKLANIFVKKISENQPLINKYPDVKPAAVKQENDEEK